LHNAGSVAGTPAILAQNDTLSVVRTISRNIPRSYACAADQWLRWKLL